MKLNCSVSPLARPRAGQASTSTLLLAAGSLGVLVVLFGLAVLLRQNTSPAPGKTTERLVFRCAAGIQPPAARIIEEYCQRYPHVEVETDFQGSGTLLESIRIEQTQNRSRSDLYLAADDTYINTGRQAGLLAEVIPVATQQPVIAVKKGNPKQIKSLADLLRDDVEVAIADPDGAAIGRVTKSLAEREGIWERNRHETKNDGRQDS